jgi:hypothetical protein
MTIHHRPTLLQNPLSQWSLTLSTVILASVVWFSTACRPALAAPLPPSPVVNPETRQCALVVPGDECGDLVLPPGWQYLDPAVGGECPVDYTTVELHTEWAGFKIPRCCTAGHSGARGDCADLMILEKERLCAFGEDLSACPALPEGWAKSEQLCPLDYTWVDDLACPAEPTQTTSGAAPTPTARPPTEVQFQTPSVEISQVTAQPTAAQAKSTLPCAGAGILILIAYLARTKT